MPRMKLCRQSLAHPVQARFRLIKAQVEKELVDLPGFHMGALARTHVSPLADAAQQAYCVPMTVVLETKDASTFEGNFTAFDGTDLRSSAPGAHLINRGPL